MSHILIVDDEVRFRELYSQTLTEAGFSTLCAASAEEAAQALEQHTFSMVISDVRMPGEDGLSLLKRVRQQQEELPFLLVTAYADIRDAVSALKLGAVDYLAKPADADDIYTALMRDPDDPEKILLPPES